MNPRVIGACCGRSDPQAPLLKTLTFAILHLGSPQKTENKAR